MSLIFTYLLTAFGTIGALFNPFIGVCVYICLAILKPTQIWWYAVPDGPYAQFVALAMLGGWALQSFGSWSFERAKAPIFLFGLFVAWSALSALFADKNPQTTWFFVETVIKFFLPCLVALTVVNSVERLKILTWVILLSLAYPAWEENIYYLQNGRVIGGVVQNDIAHEMSAGVGLALFVGLCTIKAWQKWGIWLIAGLLVHVALFHESRGAMLGLLCCGVVALKVIPKTPKNIALIFVGLIGVSILSGPVVVEEFQSIFVSGEERDGSAQSRFDLWEDMLTVAVQNPLFGIGPSLWPTVSHEFGWFAGKQGHGLWIQYCAELGFAGGAFILLFFVLCISRSMKVAKQISEEQPWILGILLGVPVSLTCWVVEAQFGSFWMMETPYYIALLAMIALKLVDQKNYQLVAEQPPDSELALDKGVH